MKYRRDITEEDYEQIMEWMYNGKSISQVARLLKISRAHLYIRMKEDEKLKDTISIGKEFSQGWWEEEHQNNLANKNFNHQGWYMTMKNRFGYCDKTETKIDANVGISELNNLQEARDKYKQEI